MDSMRSLNTSLPRTSSSQRQRRRTPSPQLLQGFKSAALSLTNFYKSAVSDQKDFRKAGYQDALDDLLGFLDHENLGLDDGEGWKVRQWATERLDGEGTSGQSVGDSDEDQAEPETRARSSSPVLQRHQNQEKPQQQETSSQSLGHAESSANHDTISSSTSIAPTSGEFSFRSTITYPQQEGEMEILEAEGTSQAQRSHSNTVTQAAQGNGSLPSIRLGILPRQSRLSSRHNTFPSSRINTRSVSSLGTGAGSKRKLAFGEFFDIQEFGGAKDTFGNGSNSIGKRGRHS